MRDCFPSLLTAIIADPVLHSLWLNTLSFWENCGARQLAACEHPTKVKEEMIKHAAEEFRHAHYLKQQIHRLPVPFIPNYHWDVLLGGVEAYHYLTRLETAICRLLKEVYCLEKNELRSLAYLVVTYAIECRAEKVYSDYHSVLKKAASSIRIYSILLEEKEHLEEISQELFLWPFADVISQEVKIIEEQIYQRWLKHLFDIKLFECYAKFY